MSECVEVWVGDASEPLAYPDAGAHGTVEHALDERVAA